jgi:GH15 family glucan-1,4-alpha-glucosidase
VTISQSRAGSVRPLTGPGRGYPAIRDLAAIGDGRTMALVSSDGTVCWMPFPSLDSPTVFGSLLDTPRGGRFELAPIEPFEVQRRYVPDTNVLETTFATASGMARVTDAMTLPLGGGLKPFRELVRHVEGLDGSVRFMWSVEPRFGYGSLPATVSTRAGVPVCSSGNDAIAVRTWGAGDALVNGRRVEGTFTASTGSSSLIALSMAHEEPLVLPSQPEVRGRLEATVAYWRRWVSERTIRGDQRDAIVRSALALKLLVHSPTGAVAAAATTSLPEEIGGERNWDYRFCWLRDSAFVMEALLGLGCRDEAEAFFWWLMHASQITRPRLQVLYRLDGGSSADERTLPLEGYMGSSPVRTGNKAVEQSQLDIYGDLLQTAWLFAEAGNGIDREFGDRLAAIANLVTEIWREPDAGIWEVRGDPQHFTQSKMLCWVALDRARKLAEAGHIPSDDIGRWRTSADEIRSFIEERCWSNEKRSYTRAAGTSDLDSSVLLGARLGYGDPAGERFGGTIDALRSALGDGPVLYRYLTDDGLPGGEGAFLCCSFWLAEVLAKAGRRDEASELMGHLVGLANDVGLYAEEVDPRSSGFLGNFPQGLSHLALITAAAAMETGDDR